jgi:hypothetical protein
MENLAVISEENYQEQLFENYFNIIYTLVRDVIHCISRSLRGFAL